MTRNWLGLFLGALGAALTFGDAYMIAAGLVCVLVGAGLVVK